MGLQDSPPFARAFVARRCRIHDRDAQTDEARGVSRGEAAMASGLESSGYGPVVTALVTRRTVATAAGWASR